MNNQKFFLDESLNTDGEGEAIFGLFVLENGMLCELDFEKTTVDSFKFWSIEKRKNSCRKINNEQNMLLEYHTLDQVTPGSEFGRYRRFTPVQYVPGRFFPRIYRPIFRLQMDYLHRDSDRRIENLEEHINQITDFLAADQETILGAVSQLSILIENLKTICRTIHPTAINYPAFGNEIRNQLILASTEVEAQFKGILEANSPIALPRPTTRDYIKLNKAMRLGEHSISFNHYPWLGRFAPFSKWVESAPTQSISWYDAYNAVKHDREKQFERGNLESLLNTISALAIIIMAQYGPNCPYWRDLIGDFFRVEQTPFWRYNEWYLPPFEGSMWLEHKLFS